MNTTIEGADGIQTRHAVVWIDHHSAKIMHFDRDRSVLCLVHPRHPDVHLHHKANSIDSGHAAEDQAYLHDVAAAIGDAQAVLIAGPANEKVELEKHIRKHDPALAGRIAAVEPMDHPSDGELLARARAFFRVDDRMRAQV
jgi:stalled ribosome rescue protein Dom34